MIPYQTRLMERIREGIGVTEGEERDVNQRVMTMLKEAGHPLLNVSRD